MGDLTIGAVGAAFIAAIISVLGLIIAKEQKISEFRQKWIDDLRDCLIQYNSIIHSVVDEIASIKSKNEHNPDLNTLKRHYSELNKASNGIKLRINYKEKNAKKILNIMKQFELLSKNNGSFTPSNVTDLEEKYIKSSQRLLKSEWNRVKTGEPTFVITKIILIFVVVLGVIAAIYTRLNVK